MLINSSNVPHFAVSDLNIYIFYVGPFHVFKIYIEKILEIDDEIFVSLASKSKIFNPISL